MINIQFVSLADGALPLFVRTDEERPPGSIVTMEPMNAHLAWPRTEVWVYDGDERKWLPNRALSRKILVGLYDLGAPTMSWDLSLAEHRVWNEHRLRELTRGLRGEGVLTFVYRSEMLWGLVWSQHRLCAVSSMTWRPPQWWNAEDSECLTFNDLTQKIELNNERLANEDNARYYDRVIAANLAPWRPPEDIARERALERARTEEMAARLRDALNRALWERL